MTGPDEYTLVLRGVVRIMTRTGATEVKAGQGFFAAAGDWVRYTTPNEEGRVYRDLCASVFASDGA